MARQTLGILLIIWSIGCAPESDLPEPVTPDSPKTPDEPTEEPTDPELFDITVRGTGLGEASYLQTVTQGGSGPVAALTAPIIGGSVVATQAKVLDAGADYRVSGFADRDRDGLCGLADQTFAIDIGNVREHVEVEIDGETEAVPEACALFAIQADFDGDGCVSCSDFDDVFMPQFLGGTGDVADLNYDGVVNIADHNAFLGQLGLGCNVEPECGP